MNIINIEIENGVKKINSRSLNDLMNELELDHLDKNLFKEIFNKISNETDLIKELKMIKKEYTTLKILMYIMYFGGLSISEANPILDKVMSEE